MSESRPSFVSAGPASRLALYSLICTAPGLHFRELVRRTGLAVGALRYHLEVLKKAGVVVEEKDGHRSRLFPPQLSTEERQLLSLVRTAGLRQVTLHVLVHPGLRHAELVTQLGFSPATVSWYLKRLERSGAVQVEIHGHERRYRLRNPDLLKAMIRTYRQSFGDKLIDRFVDLFELS